MSAKNEQNRYLVEGQANRDYVPVLGNVTDIPQRLKEIDSRFFVMFNIRSQRYEIHVTGQVGGTYGCTLPFDALDVRALEYVRRYSSARTAQTVQEIERRNERLEKARTAEKLDTAGQKMKEAYRYLDNHESADMLPEELIEA